MIPKVNFTYSRIYQELIHLPKDVEYIPRRADREINSYIREIELKWRSLETKILSYMEELTGLKWKKREIECYVLKFSKFPPFSEPLTISITRNKGKIVISKDRFVDILIHELIHNLFTQNHTKVIKYFREYLAKNYENCSPKTRTHIPLHSIHKKIYLKFFDEKRLEEDIKLKKNLPDYKASWDIVNKEGSDKILEEFKRRTE